MNPRHQDLDGMTVERCVIAQMGGGNPFRIWGDSTKNSLKNITVRDCDVIYALCGYDPGDHWSQAVFEFSSEGGGAISNVLFDNIRIEKQTKQNVFEVRPRKGPAPVDNVVFRNVSCLEKPVQPSRIEGLSSSPMSNIIIENYQILGARYQDFVAGFKAQMFNPNQWADIFKNAGAKYIVLTSKHHEGFAMWPSPQSWNWNAMDVGPHRDLLGDLTTAVKAKGLKMGYYYSLYEWFNPLCKPETIDRYVDEHMIPQMKDLVIRYQPDVLWGDGQWSHPSSIWKMPQFMAWLFNESQVKDTIAINDRWGNDTWGEHGGYLTVEYGNLKDKMVDMKTIAKPWEECKGIGYSFGYNKNENLEDYASSEKLVHDLIGKVALGGNLLLNIGPTAEGCIPVIMQQRLSDMGAWLKVNGEAIYGTRKWENAPPATPQTTTRFTRKGYDLYVTVTRWQDKPIVVEGVRKAESVSMLGYADKVEYSVLGNQITIHPPSLSPANNPCQYAWVFKLTKVL